MSYLTHKQACVGAPVSVRRHELSVVTSNKTADLLRLFTRAHSDTHTVLETVPRHDISGLSVVPIEAQIPYGGLTKDGKRRASRPAMSS